MCGSMRTVSGGAETNIYEAGRSQDIEGNYEEVIAREILSWPDMMPGS